MTRHFLEHNCIIHHPRRPGPFSQAPNDIRHQVASTLKLAWSADGSWQGSDWCATSLDFKCKQFFFLFFFPVGRWHLVLVNGESQPVQHESWTLSIWLQEKKSMPKWFQFSSYNLYSPPGVQSGRSEPWWGAACAQPRPCMACWTVRWQMWHWNGTVYSSRPFLVGNRSGLPQCIFIVHHHHHWATKFFRPFDFNQPPPHLPWTDSPFSHVQTVHFWVTSVWKEESQMRSLSVM